MLETFQYAFRPEAGVQGLEGRSRGDSGELARDAEAGRGEVDESFLPASRLGPLHEEDSNAVRLQPAPFPFLVFKFEQIYASYSSIMLTEHGISLAWEAGGQSF